VRFDVVPQLAVSRQRCQELAPPDLGAETPVEAPQPRAAEEPFDRVHLRGLEAHKVPAARPGLAEPGDRAGRHVHEGPIDPTPLAVAELEGIAPVTLLRRPLRLESHLAGIHHARRQIQRRQLSGDKERHRAALKCNGGSGRQTLGLMPSPEALRRCRQLPLRQDLPAPVLDHEHARLAVHVQSHVAFHRAALLNAWGAVSADPVVHREPYRGGGQPVFIATLYLPRLRC
jgi:hypothetical protein